MTGTDGFVGRALWRALTAPDRELHGTVFVAPPGEGQVRVDLTEPGELAKLPAGPLDAVVHVAGVVDQTAPSRTLFAVNAEGTRHLLDWARRQGCGHFIQISSIAVYGLRAMGQERREDRTPRALRIGPAYGRSKARAECHVEAAGIPYTLLRLPMVVGAGDSFVGPSLAPRLRDGSFFVCGRGNPLCSMLHVENLPRMIEAVLAGGPSDDAFHCVDHSVPWLDFARAFADELRVPFRPLRRSFARALLGSSDKAVAFLAANSRFGAHFRTEKFEARFGRPELLPWTRAVHDSAQGSGAA